MNKYELLDCLTKLKETYLTESQVIKAVQFDPHFDRGATKKMLMELVESGDVVITERHKFAVTSKSGVVRGVFCGNRNGYGFVEYDPKQEDIFIPESCVNGAVHGDTVLAKIKSPAKGRGGRNSFGQRSKEGEIIRILKRKITTIVGTFSVSAGGGVIVPDDTRFCDQVFVSTENMMGAKTNQKVVAKILAYPARAQMAIGQIVEVLGDANDLGVDTLSIIRSFGLTEKFPDAVVAEAEKVAVEPTAEAIKGRTDYTKDLIITIDGEDAKDFDDAISLKKTENGYTLFVHIADVSHYVKQDSELDKEAFNRGTSVYFPDMVLPMLPEVLSNKICSLMPNQKRLTLSVETDFDKFGNIKDYRINKGVIESAHRMTYTKVTKIFEGDKSLRAEYKDIVPMLEDMNTLAELLIKRRDNAGELDFNLPEVQIDMDEENKIKDIYRKPRNMADRLIEQFMVVTNEVVARHMTNLDMPFVYRVHEVPSSEKMHNFNDFIKGIGLNLTIQEVEPKPRDVQKVLTTVKNRPMETVISNILLRAMQKAKYYEKPLGHFGLALKDYCHFTSPIRRYPDLIIHRIIKLVLDGKMDKRAFNYYSEFVVDASTQSSDRERLADEAERTVDDLKKAEYMKRFIGKEFDGMISGVTENGFFVQLENTVEGFVKTEDLPQDKYYYDENKYCMQGKNNTFRLGQKIKIKVFNSDVVTRKIDFVLAENWDISKKI